MNWQEAVAAFQADKPMLLERGVSWEMGVEPRGYVPDGAARDYTLAMDALPALGSDPNAGIPTILTTWIDPEVYRFLFAPLVAAEILGDERRRGDWTQDTSLFPITEATGETTTYGDFLETGNADFNANWPARQNYRFQSMIRYGDLEIARWGLGRINGVAEKQQAMARALNTFLNFVYFFGVAGLQNYGLLNDPLLSASLTPATKAQGGVTWFNGNNPNASANEVYNDVIALFQQLVKQTAGLVKQDSPMCLAMSPASGVAMTFTNSFNVNVRTLLKENFPKLEVNSSGVQYGGVTASNPQGQASGLNLVQLIAREVDGQKTGFCAFSEKLRGFPVIREVSSYKQKNMSAAWGTVLRFPAGVASMIGV